MKKILLILVLALCLCAQIDTTCCKKLQFVMFTHSDFVRDSMWVDEVKWFWPMESKYRVAYKNGIIQDYPKSQFFIIPLN